MSKTLLSRTCLGLKSEDQDFVDEDGIKMFQSGDPPDNYLKKMLQRPYLGNQQNSSYIKFITYKVNSLLFSLKKMLSFAACIIAIGIFILGNPNPQRLQANVVYRQNQEPRVIPSKKIGNPLWV